MSNLDIEFFVERAMLASKDRDSADWRSLMKDMMAAGQAIGVLARHKPWVGHWPGQFFRLGKDGEAIELAGSDRVQAPAKLKSLTPLRSLFHPAVLTSYRQYLRRCWRDHCLVRCDGTPRI